MKTTFSGLAVFLLVFSSCGQKIEKEDTAAPNQDAEVEVISLSDLMANQADYLNRKVTIATYLFTHEEGAWLSDDPSKPLWNTLSLKISEASELVAANPSQFRWWFEYQEGFPIILSGVFRIGDWTKHGHIVENFPYIEVAQAREVSTENPTWKNRISKKSNKAEIATPRKPSD